jgi:hypothetical protein
MQFRRSAALLAAFALTAAGLFAQADVSKKQDVAVFALGYYGWDIPAEVFASVDADIQAVFTEMGRFNVLGQTERLSAGDVTEFMQRIKDAKAANTPLPDEIKFGDVQLTEGVLNKLYGAFVVVVPTIVNYDSVYNNGKNQWETDITTSVAFLNVAEGVTIAVKNIDTSGVSKETQSKSIRLAIDGIAGSLDYETRSISAFTINTQVLQVKGGEVKMQLGKDMGVQVGDEYVVIEKSEVAGFADEREDGLLLISNVGAQVSTATVLYAGKTLQAGAQLREIPRAGVDVAPYARYLKYFGPVNGVGGALAVGAKGVLSRGFYNLRPMVGVQATLDFELWVPIQMYAGVDYNIFLGRLNAYGSFGVGGASNALLKYILDNADTKSDDPFFTHYGAVAAAGVGFLLSRDMRVYGEAGMEYWMSVGGSDSGPLSSFGGLSGTVGVAFKL